MADSAGFPAQGVFLENLILSAVHAILGEACRVSWLRLNLRLSRVFLFGFFLGNRLRKSFQVVSSELELGHGTVR